MNFQQRAPSSFPLVGQEGVQSELLATLSRRRWTVAAFGVSGILAAIAYLKFLSMPLFTAYAAVVLDSNQAPIIDFQAAVSNVTGDFTQLNTEVEVFSGRTLIDQLVTNLDLTSDPEFNPHIIIEPEPAGFDPASLLGPVYDWLGLERPDEAVDVPAPQPSPEDVRRDTVDAVLGSIAVSNVRNSYVFRLAVTTTDPVKSARIANGLADAYIDQQIETKLSASERATTWLAERATELKAELEAAQNSLDAFTSDASLVNADALAGLNRQLKDFRSRLGEFRLRQEALRGASETLSDAVRTGDRATVVRLATDPSLGLTIPPRYLEAASAEGVEELAVRVSDLVNRSLERETLQSDAFASQVAELERKVSVQAAELVMLEQLQREVEASRLIYEHFLARLKEASVQQGLQKADSRVMSPAVVPRGPSSPNSMRTAMVGALLGVFLGAAFVLQRESRHRSSYQTMEELERETGLSVLGQVYKAPSARGGLVKYLKSRPNSSLIETVRNVRTSILLSGVGSTPKVLMVTSAVPGEGKSSISILLAHSFAGLGQRVLLIDADIRRRSIRTVFGLREGKGFISALTGEVELSEVITRNPSLNVDLLLSEGGRARTSEIFASVQFREMIALLRSEYDTIVIDTPPVLAVPDARVIGQLADAILFVVHCSRTPRQVVQDGLKFLRSAKLDVIGSVLSQVDPRRSRSYGYEKGYYGMKRGRYYHD